MASLLITRRPQSQHSNWDSRTFDD